VVGHDFGAPVAAWCTLLWPDVSQRLVLMSAPFAGPPPLPAPGAAKAAPDIHQALAALPRPRKHYQWHYASRSAEADLLQAPQGLHALLRAYYHHKSADWPGNQPFALSGWTAEQLALMPTYYVMDAALGMAATVAAEMPTPAQIAACRWLPDAELAVYAAEYQRSGFQGGLNWYRCNIDARLQAGLQQYAGQRIAVPALYIAGRSDWGTHQKPGAYEAMATRGCARLHGSHLVDGAGHWVQQEQPEAVTALLLDFLRGS